VNARDAVASGGSIRVRTRAERGGERPFAEVVVEDGGSGIAEADLPHLFEPFFTTKGTHGTGLGLAVSWGIVQAHGGTIDVRSQQGAGSRFTLRLPLAGAPQAVPAFAVQGEESRP
jgi:signal transduction histidine kinase